MISRIVAWTRKQQPVIEGLLAPISTIVANIIIVGTLLLALATYFQAQGLGQVEASLGYVDRFNSAEILQARNLIYESWLPYDFSGAGSGLSAEVVEALLDRVVPKVTTDAGVEHRLAVAVIVNFFDSASTCIDQGACSGDVLYSQVGEYGRDFYCLYRSVINTETERGRLMSFGTGLASISARKGGC